MLVQTSWNEVFDVCMIGKAANFRVNCKLECFYSAFAVHLGAASLPSLLAPVVQSKHGGVM